MDVKRSGSQTSGKGTAEFFVGTVRVDPLFEAPEPVRSLGQTLIVTSGCGWVRSEGEILFRPTRQAL